MILGTVSRESLSSGAKTYCTTEYTLQSMDIGAMIIDAATVATAPEKNRQRNWGVRSEWVGEKARDPVQSALSYRPHRLRLEILAGIRRVLRAYVLGMYNSGAPANQKKRKAVM